MLSADFYKKALRIRMIEEAIAAEYPKGEMRCPVHLSIGQEMNAVAIAELLSKDDFMVSTHRGHAHYLAKGGSLVGLLGELYGKYIGCARGNGGSMHCVDISAGFLGATSIVGGTIPIGVGSAFASSIKKDGRITAICLGDAAIEQGVFHEAANFASLHKLPVIFFMENNRYSCFTPLKNRQPDRTFKKVAEGHGLKYHYIDWDNFETSVFNLGLFMAEIREHKFGFPLFIECDAYRFVEHCGPAPDDHLGYRPQDEIDEFAELDPLLGAITVLGEQGLEKAKAVIQLEIKNAFEQVKNSPPPEPAELGRYLYA